MEHNLSKEFIWQDDVTVPHGEHDDRTGSPQQRQRQVSATRGQKQQETSEYNPICDHFSTTRRRSLKSYLKDKDLFILRRL